MANNVLNNCKIKNLYNSSMRGKYAGGYEFNRWFAFPRARLDYRKGLFPTYPIFYNAVIFFPKKTLGLYNFMNKVAAYPNFCFTNIFILRKS